MGKKIKSDIIKTNTSFIIKMNASVIFLFFQKAKAVTELRCVSGGGRRNWVGSIIQRTKLPLVLVGRAQARDVSTRWRFISYISPRI